MNVSCVICEKTLRTDKAFLDAEWTVFKEKVMCRDCQRMVAREVVEAY
jgi:uncharacterized protein YlaI